MRSVKATKQRPVLWGIPVTLGTALALEMNIPGLMGGIHHSICLFLSQTFSFVYTSSFHYSFPERTQKHLAFSHPFQQLKGKL